LIKKNFLNIFNHSKKYFLNISNITDKNSISKINKLEDNDFIQWLIGFTDAEGSFKINIKNNKEVHFIYQIILHIDDISVLYFIREKLGIGIVSINGTTCSFRVHSFQSIVDIILPIFDKYSLLTHKQLNYKDWRKAILLKKEAKKNSASINVETFNKILNIKNGMNIFRTNYDDYKISSKMVSKN
jgi:hypothetical protein